MAIDYEPMNAAMVRELGTDASYTPEGQGAQTLRGIFDYTYYRTEGEIGIQARQALFTIKESDAPNIKTSELLTVNAKNFVIAQVRPDGAGIIELDLEETV
jgi:hypothetical protein